MGPRAHRGHGDLPQTAWLDARMTQEGQTRALGPPEDGRRLAHGTWGRADLTPSCGSGAPGVWRQTPTRTSCVTLGK